MQPGTRLLLAGEAPALAGRGRLRDLLARLVRHRPALIGALIVFAFVVAALPGLWLALTDTRAEYHDRLAPLFTAGHWLGTDTVGKDMVRNMTWGAWTSLRVGLTAVVLSALIGVPLGIVGGYFGGWLDMLIGRVVDLMMAFPSILLALTIVTVLGQSLENIILAVGLVGAPIFARQVRATVLVVSQLEYVQAAHAVGFSHLRILVREILPNCVTPMLVLGTLGIGTAILDVAGLSFLGLSGNPELPEWGRMLKENTARMRDYPHLVLAPGLGIFFAVLGFNLLGDGLRDLLDPRFSRRRAAPPTAGGS
ncbi:MAG: ABC transporter permease [Planctomycetota bacterium]